MHPPWENGSSGTPPLLVDPVKGDLERFQSGVLWVSRGLQEDSKPTITNMPSKGFTPLCICRFSTTENLSFWRKSAILKKNRFGIYVFCLLFLAICHPKAHLGGDKPVLPERLISRLCSPTWPFGEFDPPPPSVLTHLAETISERG